MAYSTRDELLRKYQNQKYYTAVETNRALGADGKRSKKWVGRNPICPYGCGEEGNLLDVIMTPEGNAVGIFNDSDGCIFQADIQVAEDPDRKVQLQRDINGDIVAK